jgi:hypothetical protein
VAVAELFRTGTRDLLVATIVKMTKMVDKTTSPAKNPNQPHLTYTYTSSLQAVPRIGSVDAFHLMLSQVGVNTDRK